MGRWGTAAMDGRGRTGRPQTARGIRGCVQVSRSSSDPRIHRVDGRLHAPAVVVVLASWLLPLSESTGFTVFWFGWAPACFGCWWLNMDSENRGWIMFDYD